MDFTSTDPATGETVWRGAAADRDTVAAAIAAARAAFTGWAATPLAERHAVALRYRDLVRAQAPHLAALIARETGKPRWEAEQEVTSIAGKVDLSIAAQNARAGTSQAAQPFGAAVLRHRPHGVMAVLGPYNFPGHLPNGHVVPALLAGNTVLFKPSELVPSIGEAMGALWREAGLPDGVLAVLQGGRETGAALIDEDIDGLLFTGSAAAGAHFRRVMVDRPGVILALELGGNNPLVAWDGDPAAVAAIVLQSAYVTAGQRCSCARRLILPQGAWGDAVVDAVAALADRLRIGAWDEVPEPFMGPLVSDAAANHAQARYDALVAAGARVVRPLAAIPGRRAAFITPGLVDVTGIGAPDEEIFAPLLQITRVADFDTASAAANDTAYGLAAGLVSADDALWERFALEVRAGVINRNRPTTGASGAMPFGGLGQSGNHRPSAAYAADYCAYPVASFEAAEVADQTDAIRGLARVEP